MTVKPWIPLCQRPQKSETLRPTNSLHSTPTTARSSSIMVKSASESAASAAMKVEAEEGLGKRRISVPDQLYIGGMKKPRRERFLGCTTAKERISKMPPCVAGKRSSIYRGVTRHRWTGRYEAHLWDKTTWNQNQNKKGKQVYLGAYDDEEAAARAYDLAALKYWGAGTLINFPVSDYSRDLEEMQMISKEDYLISLRRKSSAFSRGFPKCRGASRHVQNSNLEPSLGRMLADDPSMEKKYGNDRKIDLTGYIRWWGSPKTRSSNEKQIANSEAINEELLAFECTKQSMEPYRFPSLGVSSNDALPHGTSSVKACNILSCSAAFKNFLHRLSETCTHDDTETGYDRNFVPIHNLNEASGERQADISVNYSELSRCSTGLTDWNPVDPVPDALFWNSLIQPAEIPSSSLSAALRKTEAGSPYTYDDEE